MPNNGHFYILMGVTGSGKGTLRANLEKQHIPNFEILRSYVTREMRPGESQGNPYHFIDLETFKEAIENDEFLEYEIVHKVAYYGTKKSDIENGLANGKILFKEIDAKGFEQILSCHPEQKDNITSIFLDVPDRLIEERFYTRHPEGKLSDIKNRLESAGLEREIARKYADHIIDTSVPPEEVLKQVLDIMNI